MNGIKWITPALLILTLIPISAIASSTPVVPVDGSVPDRVELDQAWDDDTRQKFWFTSQGSRIIPYKWMLWLEQARSKDLLRNAQHMESLRYLPEASSDLNPGGLPIGFALATDEKTREDWVGLTCAACHTNQIDYRGTKMLVEGAPTLGNFVAMFGGLVDALEDTNQTEEKFLRFASRVLGNEYSPSTVKSLHERLAQITFLLAERLEVNSLPHDYPADFASYARLDAFGNIQNAGTAFALNFPHYDVTNRNSPTAPVSYPFLWGTHQSDVVQWNGSAPNTPVIGPLVRNIAEVVGVFGNLKIKKGGWLFRKIRYSSTVDMKGLGHLELWVKQLRSPAWPIDHLPTIKTELAVRGKVIYVKECAGCHEIIPRSEEGNPYKAKMTPIANSVTTPRPSACTPSKPGCAVETDPAAAVNAVYHMARSLILEGRKEKILAGETFGTTTESINVPVNGVIGLVLRHPLKALEAGLIPGGDLKLKPLKVKKLKEIVIQHVADRKSAMRTSRTQVLSASAPDLGSLDYKARPLNGIWATAPYLHNGSIPNLWELMKKPAERTPEFAVGSREFDPNHVGFDTIAGLSTFRVYKADGLTIQPGNSNRGHAYGTELTNEEKWSVIEYMKTL